jgi:hypothetical protein
LVCILITVLKLFILPLRCAHFSGVYNGALGTVTRFYFYPTIPDAKDRVPPKDVLFLRQDEEPPQAIVEVEMDDEEEVLAETTADHIIATTNSSSSSSSSSRSSTATATARKRKKVIIQFAQVEDTGARLRAGGRFFVRKQFPLELAHGSTYHKAQGITLTDKHAALMPKKSPIFFGGEYVAASRVTDLKHLHLTRAVTAQHFTSHEALRRQIRQEYERLQALHVPLHIGCDD